jgi:hypothetical protein
MKKRNIYLMVLLLILIVFMPNSEIASEDSRGLTSNQITDLQLIYSSKDNNEVPFFGSETILVESGDNRNDFLVIIPFDGFELSPKIYRDPSRYTELENPRPDLPDGKKIIFSAIAKNGKKAIYSLDKFDVYSSAKKPEPVCLFADNHNNWHPSYNSRRELLAYVSDAKGAPQVFIRNLKTKQSKQLTYLAQAISPFLDGNAEWVYFTGVDQKGNYDIYKIKTDGSQLTRLTFSPDIEKYSTLTKYGKWIVYERGTKSSRSIWIMTLDGKNQKQISDSSHWAAGPCMNYTGTKVVFEGIINGKKGIYLGEVPDGIFTGATAKEFSPGMDVAKEVVNLSQFGSFTPKQISMLSQYGFFAVPTNKKQLFFTYEENEYKNIPSFVTADNLLQLLHVIFNTSLRKTEETSLVPKLKLLTESVLNELETKETFKNDPCYITLKRYFCVLYQLVNDKPYPQATAADLETVNAELAKIKAEKIDESAVFPDSRFDYSLFKVRGHYTNSPELTTYFKAMSWIGLISFNAKNIEQRKMLCLCTEILTSDRNIREIYNEIYDITAFYVGASDEPNFYDLADYWKQETGIPLTYSSYDDQKMQQVLHKLFLEKPSRIETFNADPKLNQPEVIGFMGQRYVADSHLFSLLFKKISDRYLPGGLDLFAAMENQAAYDILKKDTPAFTQYPQYTQVLQEGKQIFAKIGESQKEPLFNQWLQLLKVYGNSKEKGAPYVLSTPHWRKKKLNSALASWAELKHDTILYGKQTGVECGGGDEPPRVYGYIEPELAFYKALRQTLVSMDQNLKDRNAIGIHDLEQILELIDFFILVSEKELKQIPLSSQENEQIRIIGGLLEARTITALDANMRWWEITSESAKNMAVVADIFRYWGQYQLEGVGYADDLYIIIPVNGQLYLMRGSIFSYYEFLHEKRLTDSEWYELLKTFKLEMRSKWWQQYLDGAKEEIPVPADPYDSGC